MLDVTRRLRDDQGSTLVSVLMIMLVLGVLGLTAAAVVVNTAGTVTSSRPVLQARAAADAGIAEMVADATRDGLECASPSRHYDARALNADSDYEGWVFCDRPSAMQVTFRSEGRSGAARTTVEAVYSYTVPLVAGPGSAADGALVSGKGASLNISSIQVLEGGDFELASGTLDCNVQSAFTGDVTVRNGAVKLNNSCAIGGSLYIENGSFTCSNNGSVAGNVVVRNGSATISNDCSIGGSLFVESGNYTCSAAGAVAGYVMVRSGTSTLDGTCRVGQNLISSGSVSMKSTSKVEGDVVTGGSFTMDKATVLGSVRAGGTVEIQSGGTVTGTLASASSGTSYLYNANIGSAQFGGNLRSNLRATITGVLEVAGTTPFSIDPETTGKLRLAGTYSSWNTPKFTAETKVPGLSAPTVTLPTTPTTPQSPTFTWSDYPFDQSKWEAAGYTYQKLATTECSVQTWQSTLVATLQGFTQPTVLDARDCTELNLYNATLSLRTDLAIITHGAYAQSLVIKSGDGRDHLFSLIHPDGTENGSPTCSPDRSMNIYGVAMNEKISGIAYSPCEIFVGQGSGSRWNGQIYAGVVRWGGSGILMKLYYQPIDLPGLGSPAGGAGGGGGGASPGEKELDALVSQWDVG